MATLWRMEVADVDYVPDDRYRALPGLCFSEMKEILRSPAHYRHYKDNPPEPTKAMLLGRAVHMAVLEPALFKRNFAVMDDSEICEEIGGSRPRATGAYRHWKDVFLADNAGKEFLDPGEYEAISAMAHAAFLHPAASALLEAKGRCEASLEWTDAVTGTPMKARLDKLLVSGRVIDVKTCEDARADAFQRSIYNYAYYLQAATYLEAVNNCCEIEAGCDVPFTFICIEKSPPYAVAVYDIDTPALEIGAMAMRKCIDTFAKCSAANNWPGYSDIIAQIGLPAWANV